ncbi:MAG: hypothetical protein M1833_002482 [Piccolia ochrophora]|nr:MAG: hypothetical protein M1833_002482 [Piccolia ochrophora]
MDSPSPDSSPRARTLTFPNLIVRVGAGPSTISLHNHYSFANLNLPSTRKLSTPPLSGKFSLATKDEATSSVTSDGEIDISIDGNSSSGVSARSASNELAPMDPMSNSPEAELVGNSNEPAPTSATTNSNEAEALEETRVRQASPERPAQNEAEPLEISSESSEKTLNGSPALQREDENTSSTSFLPLLPSVMTDNVVQSHPSSAETVQQAEEMTNTELEETPAPDRVQAGLQDEDSIDVSDKSNGSSHMSNRDPSAVEEVVDNEGGALDGAQKAEESMPTIEHASTLGESGEDALWSADEKIAHVQSETSPGDSPMTPNGQENTKEDERVVDDSRVVDEPEAADDPATIDELGTPDEPGNTNGQAIDDRQGTIQDLKTRSTVETRRSTRSSFDTVASLQNVGAGQVTPSHVSSPVDRLNGLLDAAAASPESMERPGSQKTGVTTPTTSSVPVGRRKTVVRWVRRKILRPQILSLILGRELAGPTRDALERLARGETAIPEAVPIPVPGSNEKLMS